MIDDRKLPVLQSGEVVDLEDPWKTTIREEDLLRGLRARRYAADLDVTILQHSALCALLADHYFGDRATEAYAAAHDLHEAYTGDLLHLWKRLCPRIKALEESWEDHVHTSLGLEWPVPDDVQRHVKQIDDRTVAIEATVWGHPHADHCRHHHGGPLTVYEREIGEAVRFSFSAVALWTRVQVAIINHVGRWALEETP